jgi:ribonuclease HI
MSKREIIFDDSEESSRLESSRLEKDLDVSILYSDGGHNKMTGDEAWGSVVQGDGIDVVNKYKHLFLDLKLKNVNLPVGNRDIVISKFNDVKTQQNNGAELLALLMALRISKSSSNIVKYIKCDSELLVKWWTKTGPNPKTKRTMDPLKIKYINECIILRKEFESNGGIIEKISGDDNKSDLGYHK